MAIEHSADGPACPSCGNVDLSPADSIGAVTPWPFQGALMIRALGMTRQVSAAVCTECGHVLLHVPKEQLGLLRQAREVHRQVTKKGGSRVA